MPVLVLKMTGKTHHDKSQTYKNSAKPRIWKS